MTAAGCEVMRSATLAVSIAEPPPTETKPSTRASSAKSAASWSDSSVGSTRARSYTTTSMPSASIACRTRSGCPVAATPGSVTSSARFTPSRLSSQPASAAAPGPNLIGVASSVNTVSCLMAGSMPHVTDSANLLAALRGAVGEAHVLVDDDVRAPFETDWTRRFHGRASAVVRPAGADEVAAVLRACAEHGATVVPQGGNTGMVGGGVPRPAPRGDQVVVSLSRLTVLEEVDRASGQVSAGAGVTLAAL